jgi:hypothetical protein
MLLLCCPTFVREPTVGAHHLASDFNSTLYLLDTVEMAEWANQVWMIGGSSLYKVRNITTSI